jgi:hypothetical protein
MAKLAVEQAEEYQEKIVARVLYLQQEEKKLINKI